jgi:hypothetical protein
LFRRLKLKFTQFVFISNAVRRRVHVIMDDKPGANGTGTE